MIVRKLLMVAVLLYIPAIAFCQDKKKEKACAESCCKKTYQSTTQSKKMKHKKVMACKLTSPELQKRKAEVIASLKTKITKRKELTKGFSYLFTATDSNIDEISSFIKTERMCCDFFDFNMLVKENDLWLTITGDEGVKEFITGEIGL